MHNSYVITLKLNTKGELQDTEVDIWIETSEFWAMAEVTLHLQPEELKKIENFVKVYRSTCESKKKTGYGFMLATSVDKSIEQQVQKMLDENNVRLITASST
eukprot:TRINITY_DN111_c0_g1_i4.p2 TRINITY_DN111_c0_g1~~TRINITY_DN111_c0_g1_i4.p2  ORF type:complete len:102 (-),score=13.03 TRINITY_DN111_c0_g1_i4:62-367(-)